MNAQLDRPPFSTISGTMVQLSARDTIAIYLWDGLSWVAHFSDGRGELSDAATWFRVHAAWMRSGRVGSQAAVETVSVLTPAMMDKIAQLHRQIEAERARRAGASAAAIVGLRCAGRALATTLHGWSVRLLRRAG